MYFFYCKLRLMADFDIFHFMKDLNLYIMLQSFFYLLLQFTSTIYYYTTKLQTLFDIYIGKVYCTHVVIVVLSGGRLVKVFL